MEYFSIKSGYVPNPKPAAEEIFTKMGKEQVIQIAATACKEHLNRDIYT